MAHIANESLPDIAAVRSGSGVEVANITHFGSIARALAVQSLASSGLVSNFIPGFVFSPDGANLTTVESILDPVVLDNDVFTAYQFTSDFELNSTKNGNCSNPPSVVFDPENIVLLTDGGCASSCTLLGYLLTLHANVSTIAVGGRPQTGPMQWPGGVEGAQIFFFDMIANDAANVLTLSPADNVTDNQLAILAENYASKRTAHPCAVNGKNAFGPDDLQIPFQFLYEPADCRFFYTQEMINQPVKVWERAVDATWKDPEGLCVEGSRPHGIDTNILMDRWRST